MFDVWNPNDYRLHSTRLEVGIDLEGAHFGDALLDRPLDLSPTNHSRVVVPVRFAWAGLGAGAKALLTRQALFLYLMHLKSDGILAVHISNRYLDLEPVVRGVAGSLGKTAVAIESKRDDDNGVFVATWVLVTDNQAFLQSRDVQMAITPTEVTSKPQVWTDDYSNLFRILK